MNESLAILGQRRSVAAHRLAEPGPNADEVNALLTIAARVRLHGRLVPWRFVLIEGEARHRIGEAIAAAFKADNPTADATSWRSSEAGSREAPLVVAVVSRHARM